MRWWHRPQGDPFKPRERYNGLSEYEYKILADYNAEKARGIVHAPLWQQEMARLQGAWNAGQREQLVRDGWTELPGGGWVKSPA
jgi:hypothetical protein